MGLGRALKMLCLFLFWSHIHIASYNIVYALQHHFVCRKSFVPHWRHTYIHSCSIYSCCCYCFSYCCCWISLYRADLNYKKIKTNNISLFGLEWRVFSLSSVSVLVYVLCCFAEHQHIFSLSSLSFFLHCVCDSVFAMNHTWAQIVGRPTTFGDFFSPAR